MKSPPTQKTQRDGGLHPPLSRLDQWGMAISSLCLIHCILLPLTLAFLPAVASTLPGASWFHPILISTAIPITGIALWHGFQAHGHLAPAIAGATGLALIGAALCYRGTTMEEILTVSGGLVVSVAHVINWRGHVGVPASKAN